MLGIGISKSSWIYIVVVIITQFWNTVPDMLRLEAEDYIIPQNNTSIQTLYISEKSYDVIAGNTSLTFQLCLPRHLTVALEMLCIVSDMNANYLHLEVNNKSIENVTVGDFPDKTEISTHCLHVGKAIHLTSGRNTIKLKMEENKSEMLIVDSFLINGPNNFILEQCSAVCMANEVFQAFDRKELKFLANGRLKNYSYKTNCAEVDNVIVPIYSPLAKKYTITALHPSYHTSENFKHHDFKNCKQAKSLIFSFKHFRLGQTLTIGHKMVLSEGRYLNRRTILVRFVLDGPQNDSTDSEIGNFVTLQLYPPTDNIEMMLSYFGRNKEWIAISPVQFSDTKLQHTWYVPDFTWSANTPNYISIILPANYSSVLFIDQFSMRKRYMKPDFPFKMYHDQRVILEGIDADFWWQNYNGTMTVKVYETNETFSNADFIRIYVPVPWNKHNWCQVFVLYQDGNIRLLPMTPPGLDWIPFGSSVVIGHSKPSDRRPHAPIHHIDVYIGNLTFIIFYYDGNIVSLTLNITMLETSISIDKKRLNSVSGLPLLTFRSMYVTDGNADCDHIDIDGETSMKILSDWKEITGHSFHFYRRCISKHNTKSPDYMIRILK